MERLDVAGGWVEYQWVGVGQGCGHTLVFLHEGLGCTRMWGRFPHALASAVNRRGLVYSRFGYGGSAPFARPRPARFLDGEALEILPQILDRLGIRMPVLVGQSDGASIALIYAAAHPWDVAGLILESPHVFAEQATLDGIVRIQARLRQDEDFREKFGRFHPDAISVVNDWAQAWLAPAFRDWTIEPDLPAIICPILVLQAEHDPYGTLIHLDRIAHGARGPVRTVVLPGNGHAPHRDCHSRTMHEMTDFLALLTLA